MTSDSDWTQGAVRRWDFTQGSGPGVDDPALQDTSDLGYEAALPGLQTLYTDADRPATQEPKA